MARKDIYTECVARGIPTHNHESDLYIPATAETRQLLKDCGITSATAFVNQVEGGLWYDVPFMFLPYWEQKQTKAVGQVG